MEGIFSTDGPVDMEMAAAALLADNRDVKTMLRLLAKTLRSTLGERVEVTYRTAGILHRPTEEVRTVVVHMDNDDYVADLEGGAVRCSVGRSSGGIRIRNDQLPIEQWLARLLSALKELATRNQSARAALESVIVGGAL
jgi:hypothetical protein